MKKKINDGQSDMKQRTGDQYAKLARLMENLGCNITQAESLLECAETAKGKAPENWRMPA